MAIEKINSIYSNLKRFSSKPSIVDVKKGEWALRQILPPEKEGPVTIDFIYKERHVLQNITEEFDKRIFEIAKLKGLLEKEPNKNRIPRFLYHLTTQENYDKILQNEYLEPRFDKFCDEQIFLFDITNFFKQWKKKIYNYDFDLQKKLFKWVGGKTSSNLVLLRIPTKSLNRDILRTRSQEALFSNAKILAMEQDNLLKKYNVNLLDELLNIASQKDEVFLELFDWYKRLVHLTKGAPAGMNKLFTQKKNAVEYLYSEKVNVNNISVVGKINIKEAFEKNLSGLEIMKEIFKH